MEDAKTALQVSIDMYKEALKQGNFDKKAILKKLGFNDIWNDCMLCEYAMQECQDDNTSDVSLCNSCPVGVDWQVGDKGTEDNLNSTWCAGYGSPYLDLIYSVHEKNNYAFKSDSNTVKHLNGCIEVLEKAKRELE